MVDEENRHIKPTAWNRSKMAQRMEKRAEVFQTKPLEPQIQIIQNTSIERESIQPDGRYFKMGYISRDIPSGKST